MIAGISSDLIEGVKNFPEDFAGTWPDGRSPLDADGRDRFAAKMHLWYERE
jgi:hypothetical protein